VRAATEDSPNLRSPRSWHGPAPTGMTCGNTGRG